MVVLGNRAAVAMASGGSPTDRLPPPFPGAEVAGGGPTAESDSDGEDIFTGSAVSDSRRGSVEEGGCSLCLCLLTRSVAYSGRRGGSPEAHLQALG